MKNFLRQYWLWILVPTLAVLAGVVLLIALGARAENTGFDYPIF